MSQNTIRELNDAELDAVTGGQPQTGLINVGDVAVDVDVRRNEILSRNDVALNIAVGVLSAIGQRAEA
jgi:hypothetical protein